MYLTLSIGGRGQVPRHVPKKVYDLSRAYFSTIGSHTALEAMGLR
jgi:hypothetical protein